MELLYGQLKLGHDEPVVLSNQKDLGFDFRANVSLSISAKVQLVCVFN